MRAQAEGRPQARRAYKQRDLNFAHNAHPVIIRNRRAVAAALTRGNVPEKLFW